ncbi:hypothetical protein N802_05575 [Knoellia sinensis KCTC 19936]|uniref:Pyrrolo-quinoline quinone repeat domain-containing protein n=1 Tax=Knoellia sinensis KCTC 19936 TaxID=1385520 RepID=A0A0A0J0A2_9MICO|nr:PQQ-binding-like beta-propeller repeat protein [Knoellia sinensis]KGN30865.1 hypothetical protein N802_05575 [Knoellia sinensis KCTC 19936]
MHADGGGGAPGGYGIVTAPNGDVYVGTYGDGHLYRRAAGSNSTIEDLGRPRPGDTYVFAMTIIDGKLYGGTYPGGAVFSYDLATGAVRDYGRMMDGQLYVRSITSLDGIVYAGTYDCHIFAIDPATGVKTELPQPAPNCGNVSDMNAIDGRLYARIGSSIINATEHVYDPASGTWVGSIPNVAGLSLSEVGPDGKIYYMHTDGAVGTVSRFDPETLAVEKTSAVVSGRVVNNRGVGWMDLGDPGWPGQTLVQVLWRGQVVLYNPQTDRSEVRDAPLSGEPIRINVIGADDEVYVGGYLNGGIAAVDPDSGAKTFHRFAQGESILPDGDQVWLGVYPDARVYAWDRTKVWHNPAYSPGPIGSVDNPTLLHDGGPGDQNRISAVADLGNRVAFGTQPNATLTGSVVVVDKATRTPTVWEGPIADQSTVGLAARGGTLFGGTSIIASYAQPAPTTTDAHLYALDPTTGELKWSVVPSPGAPAIRGVEVDSKDRVWALTNGALTSHNSRNGDLMRTIRLTADQHSGRLAGELEYDPEANVLWALVQGSKLYAVDAQTGKARLVLERPMLRLAVSSSGTAFVSSNAELLAVEFNQG